MIRKSGDWLSLATNAERVCAEIMRKQYVTPLTLPPGFSMLRA
jgi:hypothetical protein